MFGCQCPNRTLPISKTGQPSWTRTLCGSTWPHVTRNQCRLLTHFTQPIVWSSFSSSCFCLYANVIDMSVQIFTSSFILLTLFQNPTPDSESPPLLVLLNMRIENPRIQTKSRVFTTPAIAIVVANASKKDVTCRGHVVVSLLIRMWKKPIKGEG